LAVDGSPSAGSLSCRQQYSVLFAMHVKATSPINSFSCKQIAEKVVADLKKELQHIAA
jgi:hypothetical protein